MQTQNEKIINYYTATMPAYEQVWYSPKNLSMHFGYYDANTKSHSESLLRINEVISNLANISSHDYVLDAGCGVGGSAIWLAKNIQCKVVGISIVPIQLQKANHYALKNQVSDRVEFSEQDYTSTTFENNTFSVVWAQESFCHTDHKKEFMEEAYRTLNDDGRLVIADAIVREAPPPLSKKERALMENWFNGWALSELLTLSQYQSLFQNAGFKRVEYHDISTHVAPSLQRLSRITRINAFIITLMIKLKLTKMMTLHQHVLCQNVLASRYQYQAFKLGLWKYTIVVAYKH